MSSSSPSNNTIVLIDKKAGVTSFGCLNTVKRFVNKKTGHCGTLDKFATGLLIACCGKYTKKVPSFMGMDKTYEATIEFGKETDTLDPEGEVICTGEIPSIETIREKVASLTGNIMQVPPVYSALHVNGKRSYELVRNGREVELEARPVTIKNAQILDWNAPFLKIRLEVSKGTYIRSYARDLGKLCSSCAYVTQLCRTKIGPFELAMALPCDDGQALAECGEEEAEKLIKMLECYEN